MSKIICEKQDLVDIADAIRGKTGKSEEFTIYQMPNEIYNISGGSSSGGNSGTTVDQATPTITVSSSGLITASATQSAGYVNAGTKSATKQLTTQAAKTVTPSTSAQTAVASGVYTTGAVSVAGDSNLVSSNIKSGVSIFGISGSYTGDAPSSSGGSIEILTKDTTPSSNTTSISFSGLEAEPAMFSVTPTADVSVGSTRYVVGVEYDGTTVKGTYVYGNTSSNRKAYYTSAYLKYTYSNGTLTITSQSTSTSGYFCSGIKYQLAYVIASETEGSGSGEQATPVISVSSNGLITATAGTKSSTHQLSTQASKTITPTKSEQTAVSSGVYTTGAITVGAIPSSYVQPTGTLPITENGVYDIKNYASVDVSIATSSGDNSNAVYPDGAFAPVTAFTDGKQYAIVAIINGAYRYINTTTYNNYTMNATQISIAESNGNYVIFGSTPVLFTAVASGNGFLLQNGTNYLHGTTSSGTALRFGTTQAVWTVDTSETGGFSSGKYYAKEDPNSVWLFNTSGNYNWSIKYETAGSFGYDRNGRDNTYSTGFVSFVLYEYVAGESMSGGSGGSTGSGGSAIKKKSGKTTFQSGYLTVECGFKPDLVVFDNGEYYYSSSYGKSMYYTAAVDLTDTRDLYGPVLLTNASDYKFYTFYIPEIYDTGMRCSLYGTDYGWSETSITSGLSFNYTAYKFT